MKAETAIRILWQKLDVAIIQIEDELYTLKIAVKHRNPDKAGESAPEILRKIIEIYTRLGTIAALEEIK